MPRQLLPQIEAVRSSRLLRITRDASRNHLRFENAPPAAVKGYYWLYTDYSIDELASCTPSASLGGINLPFVAGLHRDLGNVCSITSEGFRLVYNGRAGSTGIRSRLGQHFNGGKKTGALHICRSSLADLSRWRYSYVSIDSTAGYQADVPSSYEHAKSIERIWRLQHGWPLFCTL